MTRLQYLRLCSIFGAFLVGFWLPLRLIGFTPATSLEIGFDLLISGISAINIYLYFQDEFRSFRNWADWKSLGLVADIICLIPLSLFAFLVFDTSVTAILLFNLLTVRHIRQVKPFLDHFDSLQPTTYRLVPLVTLVPLIVHLVACGWIALGAGNAGTAGEPSMVYAKAVYWTFTTLTTVGYGDITPQTIVQMMYACAAQLIGVGVFGFILSNVASLLSRSDAAREHHMDNLDKIETFMRTHHIPVTLRSRIRAYYHYLWQNKKGYKDSSLLEGLPLKIQSELFMHINKTIIEKVPFLKGADDDLIEELMNELEARIFVPGERIFKIDEVGDALYFIHSGNVGIQNRAGEKLVTLSDGAFFGEMALVTDQARSATAIADTFCDVYVLHKEAFTRVTKAHPAFGAHIEEVVRLRKAS